IMYLPILSASCLVYARTLLWTENPVWRQQTPFPPAVRPEKKPAFLKHIREERAFLSLQH
ncbi:MAG: hypothetical protein ACOC57_08020, partial [Acidobacteriota bacterium]